MILELWRKNGITHMTIINTQKIILSKTYNITTIDSIMDVIIKYHNIPNSSNFIPNQILYIHNGNIINIHQHTNHLNHLNDFQYAVDKLLSSKNDIVRLSYNAC